jgi:hypothetical protein
MLSAVQQPRWQACFVTVLAATCSGRCTLMQGCWVGAFGSRKHGRHVPQQLLNPSACAQNLQQAHTSAALAAMMQGGGAGAGGAAGGAGDGHNPFEAFLGQPFQGHAPPMPDLTALNASLEGARAPPCRHASAPCACPPPRPTPTLPASAASLAGPQCCSALRSTDALPPLLAWRKTMERVLVQSSA